MSTLVGDLRSFKESSLSAEQMAQFLVLKCQLDETYITEEVIEEKPAKRRGRKASEETPQSKEPVQPEKPAGSQDTPKAAVTPKEKAVQQETK